MNTNCNTGRVGRTIANSTPWWPQPTKAPPNAANVLVLLFDNFGLFDFGYGSPIHTYAIDRLAAEGLRYLRFHTTTMCSTTRAALLTGRNHHSVGMVCLATSSWMAMPLAAPKWAVSDRSRHGG